MARTRSRLGRMSDSLSRHTEHVIRSAVIGSAFARKQPFHTMEINNSKLQHDFLHNVHNTKQFKKKKDHGSYTMSFNDNK